MHASEIPWDGPLSTLRVGKIDGKFEINPTITQIDLSELDLVVSSTKDAILMIESGASEVPEKEMLEAINFAHGENQKVIKMIEDFASEVGTKKVLLAKSDSNAELIKTIKTKNGKEISEMIIKLATKEAGYAELDEMKKGISDMYEEDKKSVVGGLIDEIMADEIRKMILSGKRPDGRKADELRKLSAMIEILPRVHGSSVFQRGQTQVMSVATLGAPSLGQTIETAEGEETKRYMHHYSMPPYATGEAGRFGSPSRREIGHGALAERAIAPVLPNEDDFPYAIRVVSEVMSSNGSTSMASTCASTLALMDAGVPIKSPVAGIAMGVIVESDKEFVVLTDITGLEDGNGDMDFKVAGTEKGITALQLDVKTTSLTPAILEKALAQAKEARIKIMKVITDTIKSPREKVSAHAPKIKVVKIPVEKIGEIIGPGGKIIKGLMAETGAQIEVEDDGTVNVSGLTDDSVNDAATKITQMTKDVMPGEVYDGEVRRIESFGAFVEILPGRDGLVHVSEMSESFVKDPHTIVKIGDKVTVRVREIDEMGRINLSMILDPARAEELRKEREANRPRGGRFERRPQRSFSDRGRNDRRGDRRDDRGGRDGQGSSGPHFPASRYVDTEKDFKKNR